MDLFLCELNLGPIGHKSYTIVTFNVLKIWQTRAIMDILCQDEGFELDCYIETLQVPYCRR